MVLKFIWCAVFDGLKNVLATPHPTPWLNSIRKTGVEWISLCARESSIFQVLIQRFLSRTNYQGFYDYNNRV